MLNYNLFNYMVLVVVVEEVAILVAVVVELQVAGAEVVREVTLKEV